MSNSVDPDVKVHYKRSHLDLDCLQKPIIIAYGSERFKIYKIRNNQMLENILIKTWLEDILKKIAENWKILLRISNHHYIN